MTEITFTTNPYPDTFEHAHQEGGDAFIKHRFKSPAVTADVAVVRLADQTFEQYVADRIDALQNQELRVPSPYTGEITERSQDTDHPLEFRQADGLRYGIGYAGPEYRVLLDDDSQLPRYRYLIAWTATDGDALEIELYVPTDRFELEEALSVVRGIEYHG